MGQPKKKKSTKKKVKHRQQVKLTGKALQKFIKIHGYNPNDALPEDYKYGTSDASDPKFG